MAPPVLAFLNLGPTELVLIVLLLGWVGVPEGATLEAGAPVVVTLW